MFIRINQICDVQMCYLTAQTVIQKQLKIGSSMSVVIRPNNAALTRDTDYFSKMDPYLIVTLGQEKQITSVCDEGGKNPQWRDLLCFNGIKDTLLKVEVWDKDLVVDDLIGKGTLDLSQVLSSKGKYKKKVSIQYQGKYSGAVYFQIQSYP